MGDEPGDVTVRDLRAADRSGWDELWAAYLEHYRETLPPAVTDATWRRMTSQADGRDPRIGGLAAVAADGALLGFAHYVVSPSTWSTRDEAYLSDLVVGAEVRSRGIGHALIAALVARGRRLGWRRLHWITEEGNATARRLYDDVGVRNGFIQYEIDLE